MLAGTLPGMLTDTDKAVLDFEGKWINVPASGGRKDAAIFRAFGVTPARHYQRVMALLEERAALEYAPGTVAALRRLLEQRVRTGSLAALRQ